MSKLKSIGMMLTIVLMTTSFASAQKIPGYTHGQKLTKSPISLEVLAEIKKSLLFTAEDEKYLRMSRQVLEPQVEEVLDVWYGFVASNPHLVYYFSNAQTKKPDGEYLGRVRKRFGRWILDTANANYDQNWLNYQYQIALRHHRTGKNKTDNAPSVPHIHFRHLVALHYPITATLKPFLAKGGHSAEDVEKMHQAWIKSVQLQVILWSYPYVKDGDY